MSGQKSSGEAVLMGIAEWISQWIVFPGSQPGLSLLAALWAIHAWFVRPGGFPATTYVHVVSAGPGCGKSTLMQVLQALCPNGRFRPTLRELSVVRDVQELRSVGASPTYFFDQVEALSTATKISDGQAILLSGYTEGGEHGVSVGQKQVSFSTYCAKMFASIGDVFRDLRTRVVLFPLVAGVPRRVWTDEIVGRQAEARDVLEALFGVIGRPHTEVTAEGTRVVRLTASPKWVPPSWLAGRDREIFTPLWSVAVCPELALSDETLAVIRVAIDTAIAFKLSQAPKQYRETRTDDAETEQAYAVKALRQLAAVMPKAGKVATGHLASAKACAAMVAADPTWQFFRGGKGLTPVALAGMMASFGLATDVVRETRGRGGKQVNGYRGDAVAAAVAGFMGEGE